MTREEQYSALMEELRHWDGAREDIRRQLEAAEIEVGRILKQLEAIWNGQIIEAVHGSTTKTST